ncbi:LLM class flavin-dependent oxidoreductase [Sporichthya polymorpha]|uniref:LLM class flavin-dependent oxidoreductase n=1 Tax=Sporichthya polymorpha TaxID=35751 RepID=UPI00037E2193|nr:LLM class flavin-dependent oxidoreductase [Sporichthya polymorpha]
MPNRVRFAVPFDNHRTTPLSMIAPFTAGLEQGGIDFLWLWDELSCWFPGNLWNTQNSPAADFVDGSATHDPFVEAAFALAANPHANVRVTTDAVRSAPAELLRKMLTLAHGTDGDVVCALGAGELRQTKPFGYKRAEGLKRLEDMFVLMNKLWEADAPFSHEGNIWNYKNAFIGTSRPEKRPEFWALGGGPMLLEIAAKHADGFEAAVPQAITTPEKFADQVKAVRRQVEEFGRDPDAFGFGIWNICICHDDPDTIDRIVRNPLAKYFAAQFGRLDTKSWADEGFNSVMPENWHYAMHWAPFEQSDEEINAFVSNVSDAMSRAAFFVGSPKEMAEINAQFVEAGASFVGHLDFSPLVLGPADAQDSVRRAMEVAAQTNALVEASA